MSDREQAALTAAAVAIHDADCSDTRCSGSALGHAHRLARAALEAAEAVWPHGPPRKVACSEIARYQPIAENHTHVVTCRRPAAHDGMHEGEGFGGASVVWPINDAKEEITDGAQ